MTATQIEALHMVYELYLDLEYIDQWGEHWQDSVEEKFLLEEDIAELLESD